MTLQFIIITVYPYSLFVDRVLGGLSVQCSHRTHSLLLHFDFSILLLLLLKCYYARLSSISFRLSAPKMSSMCIEHSAFSIQHLRTLLVSFWIGIAPFSFFSCYYLSTPFPYGYFMKLFVYIIRIS